ncbi:DNA damage-binding protein cmr1 [Talaromyces atroroseus]|uniref:DNA damage-binding protein CMR1 n=1 Tax=Talaromyces atroroseus TaxID=1441469 RepID=A0A225B1Y0_TALAT|nr:DNA damage-binding protein cmr1 [Talaromyces atroroseus]OKL63708.1 DNA damage-binding protein cmr1 [Talaromyces atroroseus]
MPRPQTEELSQFEKQRLANIAERDALLKKLTLEAQSTGLFSKPSPKPGNRDSSTVSRPKKKPAPRVKKEENEAPIVRRMSSRLRGLTADSEVAKRKADEAFEESQRVEREKRLRKSDFFTLDNMLVSGQKLTGDALIGIDVVTKGVAKPYERTFSDDDVRKTTDKDLKVLREEMSSLELWDQWTPGRIKITPERIYTMAFHPSEAKPLIFAGDKMGHLGVLDASQKRPEIAVDEEDEYDEPDPAITTLKPHTRTISSMVIQPHKLTHLYTASYDSSIREMDLEKMTSEEKYAPESRSIDEPISGIDMASDDPNCLYWTTLSGLFNRYDLRSPNKPMSVEEWQLSEKKIGGFSLFPSHPHFFATASLDRTMRLWDIRKLSHSNPESIGEHESRLSVSHAAFNSVGQIATSSYDDSIKLYDFGKRGIASWKPGHKLNETTEMKPDTVVRHNCQTGRWVTILRPHWQQNPQSPIQRFCIANMNRFVDIYTSNGDQLAQLGGDDITAVPAVAVFHRSKNWVAGGTASGKVCLWM